MLKLLSRKRHIYPPRKQPTEAAIRHCVVNSDQPAVVPDAMGNVNRVRAIKKISFVSRAGALSLAAVLTLTVFLLGCGIGGTSNQTGGNSSLSTPSVPPADVLTEEQMLDILKSRGIWGPLLGWHKYGGYEIVRVGPYSKEGRFYPVQVKVSDPAGDGGTRSWIWDCHFLKNDYGDWEVRKMGM